MLAVVGAVIAIIVSLLGLVVQIIAVGIYIGKLEGFKALVDFRFQALEKKQDKHNNLMERVYKNENKISGMQEKLSSSHKRSDDLQRRVEHLEETGG